MLDDEFTLQQLAMIPLAAVIMSGLIAELIIVHKNGVRFPMAHMVVGYILAIAASAMVFMIRSEADWALTVGFLALGALFFWIGTKFWARVLPPRPPLPAQLPLPLNAKPSDSNE